MTYCVGVLLDEGMVFASDSRTHAGVDNFASFCKMTVINQPGDRMLTMLSSGNLAGTQAVLGLLRQRAQTGEGPTIWNAKSMFEVASLVGDAMRDIDRRDGPYLAQNKAKFDASFILGGQIAGETSKLFRIYSEGNFVEAGDRTIYFQTGETKYGKPILERVIHPSTPLNDAAKCVLVSFDSTMKANLSVGMPIDLVCYEKDSLELTMQKRFESGDPYFTALHNQWSKSLLEVFRRLPNLTWQETAPADPR